jgi:hypothetical protein
MKFLLFITYISLLMSAASNGEIYIWDPKKLEIIKAHKTNEENIPKKLVGFAAAENFLINCKQNKMKNNFIK